MENLESHGIKEFHFPGLQSHGMRLLVLESHGKLKVFFFSLVTASDIARTMQDREE